MSKAAQAIPVAQAIPDGAVELQNSSANLAATAGAATLTIPAGHTGYLEGFVVTAAGATAGLAVTVTVTGLVGGTQNYTFTFPTGATAGAVPLVVDFPVPMVGIAGTNIVVNLPSSGLGGTNASVVAQGYYI